jgi:hypothetical protein
MYDILLYRLTNSIAYSISKQHMPSVKERNLYKFIYRYEKVRLVLLPVWILVLMPFNDIMAY